MKRRHIVPPGDHEVPVPAPVDEEPPADQFCDLVLTGGVASGVVYPWAIVELARAYRFRSIGGTSVGAMAAALAAAAEYGRRTGFEAPFEPLRRMPGALAEVLADGRTRMFSLFQPAAQGRRLMALWRRLGRGQPGGDTSRRSSALWTWTRALARVYAMPLLLGALLGALAVLAVVDASTLGTRGWPVVASVAGLIVAALMAGFGALAALALALGYDIWQGVKRNNLGLCKGGTLEPQSRAPGQETPGLCEWLHEAIQRSAGLEPTDRPVTFRDLWNAPASPGAPPTPCTEGDPPERRAIDLQLITTNATHGRPYRLPLADDTSRLFFVAEELRDYLPPAVLQAMVDVALPYAPRERSDPDRAEPAARNGKTEDGAPPRTYLQLPGADLPLVVAARLSLSFPFLFAAVPLYAIDYELPRRSQRRLRRCLFIDGGVSSNFPIHLFDAAVPAWPTFGLWLDRRSPHWPDDDVWLPEFHRQGWGDNWDRFDPLAGKPRKRANRSRQEPDPADKTESPSILGFLLALASSATDWRDRTSFRLPHVRNRVARLLLKEGEGGLHIAMPGEQILRMAHRYGTQAGKLFVRRFAPRRGRPTRAWCEQRWVRLHLLINGLRERLDGLADSAANAPRSLPLEQAIDRAVRAAPLREEKARPDFKGPRLGRAQADALQAQLQELQRLEALLREAEPQGYKPRPEPELRLRAPL